MTCPIFATSRLNELYVWARELGMSVSDIDNVSNSTRHVLGALVEAPHWQILDTYWNTAVQQNNIWFIPFETCTMVHFKVVHRATGTCWIVLNQTCTRIEHKSTRLNFILFSQPRTPCQCCMISTALNPTQCISNSFIPWSQTIIIMSLSQSMWKVVYEAQIQPRES